GGRSPTSAGRSFAARRRRRTRGPRPASNGRPSPRRRRTTSSTPPKCATSPMPTAQFDSPLQQRSAALLGMWAFLATEVMFFGPLFFGYLHARAYQGEAFVQASHHTNLWLGTANTAILLTSSLTMALAVHESKANLRKRFLLFTALLGLAFLCIKAVEYAAEWSEPASLFLFLYFAMTGLHAIHLAI